MIKLSKVGNSCGIGGGADNGCEVFNTDWATANGCKPGDCEFTWPNFDRRRRDAEFLGVTPALPRERRGTQDPLSGVYFQCDGCTTSMFFDFCKTLTD